MRAIKITQSITHRENPSFDKYLKEVSKVNLITKDEEIQLGKRIKEGDRGAIDKLVKANLRFVISVAKQYLVGGMELEDLVNEGNIGLIKAAQKWDESRGIKFISYAVWWIRQSILQSISDNSRAIRLPINQINSLNKIKSVSIQLEQELGRTPTQSEISETLNIDECKVNLSLSSSHRIVSLDTPIRDEEDFTIGDFISSDNQTDDYVIKEDDKNEIMLLIKNLSDRERFVIQSSFGIGMDIKTLMEVADDLLISIERVRQIKNSTIKKLAKRF
jgi:RNA polymerase primary sigma factor